MNKKAARKFDSLVNLLMLVFGGICFGIWQHSFCAGVVAAIAIQGLLNIGWAIEYGDMDYD